MNKRTASDKCSDTGAPSRNARAVATPRSANAKQRWATYKFAFSRIDQARAAGFHLEAITLIESLLSDRLESRLSFLLQKDFGFKTLGQLVRKSAEVETDAVLKSIVTKEIAPWGRSRNAALHEMAKIAEGDARKWGEKYASLEAVASEGRDILNRFHGELRTARRRQVPT